MKITIRIDGKEKVFTTDFIPGRILRRALEITGGNDLNNIGPDTLDMLVDFVVEKYGKQFSRDDFYDGIDGRFLIKTIMSEVNGIVESAGKSVGADPNDPN